MAGPGWPTKSKSTKSPAITTRCWPSQTFPRSHRPSARFSLKTMPAAAELTRSPAADATDAPEMTSADVKRHIYRNSISNYSFLIIRLGLGAVLFRLIYQELSKEDLGFWSLL